MHGVKSCLIIMETPLEKWTYASFITRLIDAFRRIQSETAGYDLHIWSACLQRCIYVGIYVLMYICLSASVYTRIQKEEEQVNSGKICYDIS